MKSRFITLFTIALAVLLVTACNKEEDTLAEVKVITPNGSTVAGAEVRLFGQGTTNATEVGEIRIDVVEFTSSNGLAKFDFTDLYVPGQSGFAILNVEITKEYPDSTVYMEGIIKIVEEQNNQKTFTLVGQ
ncbi:hypothetical protein G3O08_17395 [Cryomorpha ignava]|uniref:DUF4625 domain-containing protein n=1 Tax=Cryomorpha ignava TaxID=101383 RepID=A0A7K3WXA6_9FLAO|nr:hypothetical protein [Cryomorpha ignava]NEN25275.1 hypothetical protein [Cryomorpha ignava]